MDRPGAEALEIATELSERIGPRRPCSEAEARAAAWTAARLGSAGFETTIDPFPAFPTFAAAFGPILGLAAASRLVSRPWLRGSMAGAAAGAMAAEGGLRWTPVSQMVSRWQSQNVVGTLEPRGFARRTVCLVAHLDSSRSGLMFHPKVTPYLGAVVGAQSAAVLAAATGGAWALANPGSRAARALGATGAVLAAAGFGLMVERELRGVDVPGANDNASGVGVAVAAASEFASRPLEGSRLVVLLTGAEEAGTLGSQAFLRSRDTHGWVFLNVDGVGAEAPLRYLPREGITTTWRADPALVGIAERIARERPELGLGAQTRNAGLTYDATPVLARGGRAMTLTAQGRVIPDYHWPTDRADRLSADTLRRAVAVVGEIVRAVDRGEAG